ncbi:MAG: SCO family protein [Candidatus Viridilinea halotolerans]|uniref:SCO family protein n=1 Tax=Candidatus Viridilinea halotolerans TaxID=2491704 RepID=A0A426TR01_9CHLR|nr:MAG: SCO family protein [Candidatus Viridilinea halotolerans]
MRKYISLLLLTLALASLGACGRAPELKGTRLDPALPAPDFTLTDHTGQPFTLSEQQDKVVLLYFGFTSCPDICPIELSNLATVKRELGAAAADVEVAMITVDPERDLPERLAIYVTHFDPAFIGLHGEPEELAPIYRDYGVHVERRDMPQSAMVYTIDHSGFVYLIDKAGRWRTLYAHNTPAADIVSDLRILVRE